MAGPSWMKRFDDYEDEKNLQPRSLSRYPTTHGSLSELSLGAGSTRYIDSGNESDTGQSKYSFYSEKQAREVPRRYLSPANANRYRTLDQNYGRRHLNSRYQSPRYSQEDGGRRRTESGEPRREQSWAYIDNAHGNTEEPSIHVSASYGDLEGTTSSASSSVYNIPRIREPSLSGSQGLEDKRSRRKTRETSSDETGTSGYSTNSISELSEFSSPFRTDKGKLAPSGGKRRQSSDDRGSKHSSDRLSSRDNKSLDRNLNKRSESSLSVNDSVTSLSSSRERTKRAKEAGKRASSASIDSKHNERTQKAPTIGNVAVTVTNNIQYDPNDPFSFIQPVDLPFHVKVRKCLGPIIAVVLLLILAAALGAAIYFAAALKETQENQIDLLKATLAMKIRNTGYIQDIDDLSTNDFQFLSSKYCKQMDVFYSQSQFRDTYRGCEVLAIKNHYINFTLFFIEKEATSSEIVDVIESSAPKVQKDSTNIALVDKFELELDSVKVTMERQVEPDTFNKKNVESPPPQPPPPVLNENDKKDIVTDKPKETVTQSTKKQELTTAATTKKKVPEEEPVYSWRPCSKYEGGYFPHPVYCDKFFQCTNGQTIEHKCTKGLIYHWKDKTCVSKFMPNVECPDPDKAPPRPTTPATTASRATTPKPTTRLKKTTPKKTKITTTTKKPRISKIIINGSITAIAGKFAGRPDYPADPCQTGKNGALYPHQNDCGKFIQCVNGQVQKMTCAPKLVFHPGNKQCIFPTNPELVCPDIQPCKEKDDGYFPHPFDCSKFIQCQFKKEVVLACQTGLVWNSGVNSCVHKTPDYVCPYDSLYR